MPANGRWYLIQRLMCKGTVILCYFLCNVWYVYDYYVCVYLFVLWLGT